MRDENDPISARLALDLFNEFVQPDRSLFDVEAVRRDRAMQLTNDAVGKASMGRFDESSRSLVVEAINPNRLGINGTVVGPFEIRTLIALDEKAVAVIDHQAKHRAFKLIEDRIVRHTDTHVGCTFVETVERVVHLCIDARSGSGISADVHDWLTHCFPHPGSHCAGRRTIKGANTQSHWLSFRVLTKAATLLSTATRTRPCRQSHR